MRLRWACNALGISGSAMFAGVMLAIGVTLGGDWRSLPPGAFLDGFGRDMPFIMRSIGLVVPPALVGMAGSLWLARADRRACRLWLAGSGCIVAVLVITAAYFLPSNARFAGRSIPPEQVPAALETWLLVHDVRIALAALASVLGVAALGAPAVPAGIAPGGEAIRTVPSPIGGDPMLQLRPLDPGTPISEQLGSDAAPVVLVNLFEVAEADVPALMAAWEADANWMKRQPGYISAQLHRAVGGSRLFLNYAVWESVAHFRAAFTHPDFRAALEKYPSSAVASPHLFRRVAVPGLCPGE